MDNQQHHQETQEVKDRYEWEYINSMPRKMERKNSRVARYALRISIVNTVIIILYLIFCL